MEGKKQQKYLYILAAFIFPALVMTGIEYGAQQSGLELRTFAQEIKGTYLWLVMPLGILYTVNRLLRLKIDGQKENPKAFHLVRRILSVFLALGIFMLSFCRGIFYTFTEEMVEEERVAEDYLKGTLSALFAESRTVYYESVAGIFRKPFPGWDRQQLAQKTEEKYGPGTEYVEAQPGGWHLFRLPDPVASGEFIYFHMSDSYERESNGDYQILASAAGYFWENRNRRAVLGAGMGISFEEARDTGKELQEGLPYEERLYITCYDTEDDIAACAADLTDWLRFLGKAAGYPFGKEESTDRLASLVMVGNGEDYFRFDMEPGEIRTGDGDWEEEHHRMKERLTEAFKEHREEQKAYEERLREQETDRTEGKKGGGGETGAEESSTETGETKGWDFMDTYDGSFEKECQVGDGRIRYRMVVEDAALGSRFYGLLKSVDGGESWQMSNPDPFDQQLGQGIDFTFLDEKVGFATLMHNGGDRADLYVTRDAGESYRLAVMEGYTVSLDTGFTYNPYDYPQMPYGEKDPYEEGDAIYVLCGQGADGDYNGGDAAGLALYRSMDGGYTFTFEEIRKEQ